MCPTKKMYKNNMLIFVYTLFCLQTLHVYGEKLLNYYVDDPISDVKRNTISIYRMINMSNIDDKVGFINDSFFTEYTGSYTSEVHLKPQPIMIPIQNEKFKLLQTNIKELFNVESIGSFQNNSRLNVSFDSELLRVKKIFPNGENCDCSLTVGHNYNSRCNGGILHDNEDTLYKKCFNTFEYRFFSLINRYGSDMQWDDNKFFSLVWIPDTNYTCLSITYLSRWIFGVRNFVMKIVNENNELLSEVILGKDDKKMKILKLTDITFIKDQKYKLTLEVPREYYGDNEYYIDVLYFGLFRIDHCSNFDYATAEDQYNNYCLNNGYLINTTSTKEMTCICPLGFSGNYCQIGCGMNLYGTDCNEVCSIDYKMCRGMFMCTDYGCSCPAGLTGPMCNEDCKSGSYGSDCRQICPLNCQNNTCDQYTGVCLDGCLPGYILPYCITKYPYLANAPTPISIEFETIQFELNFQSYNINEGDESIHVKYYQMLYKSSNEDAFSYSEVKLISQNENTTMEILYDLLPHTKYLVGVLLITDDGNQNDQDIVFGEYITSCIQPQIIDYNVKLTSGVKSIYVTWNKITPDRLECNIDEFVLTLQLTLSNQSHSVLNDTQEIIANSDSHHLIDNLLPGFQYSIKLTPKTIKGPLLPSPTYSITTLTRGNNVNIKNLTIQNEDRKIKINWKLINLVWNTVNEPVTCIIRYKVVKILSCSLGAIKHNWTSIKVFNRTDYEIIEVIPNSQYMVQVFVDGEDTSVIKKKNMAYFLTSETYPTTEPVLDNEHPIYVTNNSANVQWKLDPENCIKLNGFFSKFYIQLKEKNDITLQTKETKQSYIFIDGLKSNTAYELKVFIKTHNGYNLEHFLSANFTTKHGDLMPVDDLMVYKKSLKNRMAGFRWSYVANTNIDGFIVSFNDTASVIPLERCSAWPQYYCHTFYNLSPSNAYTFKIMPKSPDNPEGGKVSSISFNSIDGLPDPPMNLKTTEVDSTFVKLQWDIPWIFNGMIKTFIINAEEISAVDMNTCCVSITPIEISVDEELPYYNYTLVDLKPGSTYSIGVLTVSKSLWYSSLARISVVTIN